MTPAVSILVPVFNQVPAYLRAALLSAKRQTHKCQIVVVDDGSEPRQWPIVEEVLSGMVGQYGIGEPIYQAVYDWQENKGVAGALNQAIKFATGEYIQWLPSDDVFLPEKTAVQLAALQRDGGKVSYTAYEEGIPQIIQTVPAPQYPTQVAFFEALREHCFVNSGTIMWHRSVFEEVGVFKVLLHCEDAEFALRCAEKFNYVAVNRPLVRRRIHQGQLSQELGKAEAHRKAKEESIAWINERYGSRWGTYVPPTVG